MLWRSGIAQPPAGHRIGLGKPVDGDRQVAQFVAQRGDGNVLSAVVHQLFVDLIGQDHDVLASRDFADFPQFLFGVNRASRVAGRVEDDHFGGRGHRLFELLGGHFPTGGFHRFHDHWHAASQTHHFRVGNPVRRGNDHFIALFHHRQNRVVTSHLGPCGDADLLGIKLQLVVLQQLGGDRLAKLRNATGRGVFGAAFLKCLNGGCLDEVRGIHLWLAASERVNFLALGNHGLGLIGDSEGEGRIDLGNAG